MLKLLYAFGFAAAIFLGLALGAGIARADRASYYCGGQQVAAGGRYNPNGMTAAHRTLPFGTRVRVTHRGRSVNLCINDRGPFVAGRTIDVSCAAGRLLGLVGPGHAAVRVEVLRRGNGKRGVNVC